jgi:hypothetical protein
METMFLFQNSVPPKYMSHAKGVYLIKRNVVLPKTATEKTKVSESPMMEETSRFLRLPQDVRRALLKIKVTDRPSLKLSWLLLEV